MAWADTQVEQPSGGNRTEFWDEDMVMKAGGNDQVPVPMSSACRSLCGSFDAEFDLMQGNAKQAESPDLARPELECVAMAAADSESAEKSQGLQGLPPGIVVTKPMVPVECVASGVASEPASSVGMVGPMASVEVASNVALASGAAPARVASMEGLASGAGDFLVDEDEGPAFSHREQVNLRAVKQAEEKEKRGGRGRGRGRGRGQAAKQAPEVSAECTTPQPTTAVRPEETPAEVAYAKASNPNRGEPGASDGEEASVPRPAKKARVNADALPKGKAKAKAKARGKAKAKAAAAELIGEAVGAGASEASVARESEDVMADVGSEPVAALPISVAIEAATAPVAKAKANPQIARGLGPHDRKLCKE